MIVGGREDSLQTHRLIDLTAKLFFPHNIKICISLDVLQPCNLIWLWQANKTIKLSNQRLFCIMNVNSCDEEGNTNVS